MAKKAAHEHIRVNPDGGGGNRWAPIYGPEAQALIASKNLPDGTSILRDEAASILSQCIPPAAPNRRETGLVVGYVQSGKTLSFTTVTALARDNGFQLVIVIAGTSVPLFKQSDARLQGDLRLEGRPDRVWRPFDNPKKSQAGLIRGALDAWKDKNLSEALRQTVLITVMKNSTRLDQAIETLRELDLDSVPTLIVDDEADQAGLNTKVSQGATSAIYERLLALKDAVPHHTFLQYTATPQAPLLINLIDVLSPHFVEVLTPGRDYVGGNEFFISHHGLIETIPNADIPSVGAMPRRPPESLRKAMRFFFLGVADGYKKGALGYRSMMVHPSQLTVKHHQYYAWVTAARREWLKILKLGEADKERKNLLNEFEQTYQLLKRTVPSLPPFNELAVLLPHTLGNTNIVEINSVAGTNGLKWKQGYSHILVGGQAMDRGFTVEGLTVTYMPRGVGVGQADTLQQRARFFGYKRKFLGYCRVFLEGDAIAAYTKYVEHEEHMRKQLIAHKNSGKSLSEWKRALLLDKTLKPTRRSVLGLDYMRDQYSDTWIYPFAPQFGAGALERNRSICREFVSGLKLTRDVGHPKRTAIQRHMVVKGLPLLSVYEDFLSRLSFPHPKDSSRFLGLLLQLGAFLEKKQSATCSFYQMSSGKTRERKFYARDEIENLFQGEYPVKQPGRGSIYPGDRFVGDAKEIRIQLHTLDLRRDGVVVVPNVPAIAIWIPRGVGSGWLVQEP